MSTTPVKLVVSGRFLIEHRHGTIGPDSRDHSHVVEYRVSETAGFDPKSGHVGDYASFYGDVKMYIAAADGRNLNDEIPGIKPTIDSLAIFMRERLLLSHPTISIVLATDEYEVEVP